MVSYACHFVKANIIKFRYDLNLILHTIKISVIENEKKVAKIFEITVIFSTILLPREHMAKAARRNANVRTELPVIPSLELVFAHQEFKGRTVKRDAHQVNFYFHCLKYIVRRTEFS